MKTIRTLNIMAAALAALMVTIGADPAYAADKKPNILFIRLFVLASG